MIDDLDDQRIESTELPIPATEAEIIDWSSDWLAAVQIRLSYQMNQKMMGSVLNQL